MKNYTRFYEADRVSHDLKPGNSFDTVLGFGRHEDYPVRVYTNGGSGYNVEIEKVILLQNGKERLDITHKVSKEQMRQLHDEIMDAHEESRNDQDPGYSVGDGPGSW